MLRKEGAITFYGHFALFDEHYESKTTTTQRDRLKKMVDDDILTFGIGVKLIWFSAIARVDSEA
jgi:hypothetical protein